MHGLCEIWTLKRKLMGFFFQKHLMFCSLWSTFFGPQNARFQELPGGAKPSGPLTALRLAPDPRPNFLGISWNLRSTSCYKKLWNPWLVKVSLNIKTVTYSVWGRTTSVYLISRHFHAVMVIVLISSAAYHGFDFTVKNILKSKSYLGISQILVTSWRTYFLHVVIIWFVTLTNREVILSEVL